MSAKKTCDLYFSKVVRARGVCERCGAPPPHECAHVIRRWHVGDPDGIGLRWNEDNAWCLCHDCHTTVDTDVLEYAELLVATIGVKKYDELIAVKNAPHRPWRERDWVAERARLLALLKEAA